MKFLKININYTEMMNDFFEKYPNLDEMNYDEVVENYFYEGYWPSNGLEKSLSKKYDWECDSLVFTIDHNRKNEVFFDKWCEKYGVTKKSQNPFENLLMQIIHYSPDIIYFHEIWFFPAEFFEKIRFLFKNIIIFGWDCAPGTYLMQDRLKYVDMVFTCFAEKEAKFKENGINSLMVGHFFDADVLTKTEKSKKIYDVVFAGTLNRTVCLKRVDLLKYLIDKGVDVHIFGTTDDQSLKGYCSKPVYGNNFFKVIQSSKIVLNQHVVDNRKFSGNIRMYEVTGVGSLLLTDYKEDLHTKFDIDREIVTYDSFEEIYDKINHYLVNEEEREKIAVKGQMKTLADYTYENFAAKLYEQTMYMKNFPKEYALECYENILKQHFNNNLAFATLSNKLILQVKEFASQYDKIALYGNGNVTTLIKSFIPNIVVIADKTVAKMKNHSNLCNPEELNDYHFDVILLTVLGREEEIEIFLTKELNLEESKILKFIL